MNWRDTSCNRPNTSADKVFVRYRCGLESKAAYPTLRQRWDWRGEDFDIVAYAVPPREVDEGRVTE